MKRQLFKFSRYLGLGGAITLTGCFISVFSGNDALAQITPDATLGAEPSIVTPLDAQGFPVDRIDGGAIRGTNLFHSFLEFNIAANRGAYFFSPANIKNILTRVTGSNASQILGTLGTFGASSPNLFLINPNGIIFGQNASLDVGGSFVASTASSIKLADGTEFRAANPTAPPLLTISAPLGLQFNGNESNIITSSGLEVQPGQTLALVGGQVSLEGATLIAPGGRVELGGLAGEGTVGLITNGSYLGLSFPVGVPRSDVSLSNGAQVNVRAGGGGSIGINALNLTMTQGSQLLAGIAPDRGAVDATAGNIEINATGLIDLTDDSGIYNSVRPRAQGQGGDINITSSLLRVSGGAQVLAATFGEGDGGNLTVNVSQQVQLIGTSADGEFPSGLTTSAQPGTSGKAGDLTINTNTLLVQDGAQVSASTFGEGNGGNLTVNASQQVQLIGTSADGWYTSGLFADADQGASGKAGDLTINTNTLLVRDGAQVSVNTSGEGDGGNLTVNASQQVQVIGISADGRSSSGLLADANQDASGKAGDLTINTDTLLVRDGAVVSAATMGEGDGGNLTINAFQVQLIGTSADGQTPNGLFSQTQGTGDAGDLIVNTNTLLVRDGSQVSASTFGEGNGGNLTVNASQQVQVIGTTADGQFPSGLFASAVAGSSGNAGDLTITTNTLVVRDGAQVSASTFSEGDGRNLTVNASQVQLIGTTANGQAPSGLFAQTQGTGNAGDLTVNTDTLLVRDGAEVSASSTYGTGNGGNLTINASESVLLIDAVCCINIGNGFLGGLFTQTEDGGNAGDLTINTDYLLVRGGMSVSATTSGDASGDITVTANTVELIDGGQLRTTTKASQDAGNIILRVRDRVSLVGTDSGLLANTTENSSGNGGSIFIHNPETVIIQDGARIAVDSQGSGAGGDIEIQAGSVTLENQARLLAETASNTGGNITLQLRDLLLLRNNSKISTTAGTDQAGGDGGNITIDTDFIVAVPKENSDITANAFQGRGGNINISATGIYGIDFRPRLTPLSDITASSETGVNGIVDINTSGIDPVRGIVNLPTEPVNNEVAQDCQTSGGKTTGSFINTGRGGLPTHPYEPLDSNDILADVQPPTQWTSNSSGAASSSTSAKTTPEQIVEANGWIINENGEVVLVAQIPSTSAQWGCRLR